MSALRPLLILVVGVLMMPTSPTGLAAQDSTPADEGRDAILAALGGAVDGRSGVWYTSNREFMRLEAVEPTASVDGGWMLWLVPSRSAAPQPTSTVETSGSSAELAILYRDGTPVGGESLLLDAAGRVRRRHRVDAAGATTLEERMVYRGDGTLRSIRHCVADGCLTARFAPPGVAGEESVVGDDLAVWIRFDADARPEYIRTERPSSVREEFRTYADGVLSERRIVEAGAETRERYVDGRIVRREERSGGRLIRGVDYRYDDRGRRVEQVTRERNATIRETWSYSVDAEIHERFENGTLVLRERVEGEEAVRTHFRDGAPVVREVFSGDTLVSRSIYRDGTFRESAP